MSNTEVIRTDAITADSISEPLLREKNIHLSILRLDKIHPVISGNKWFKLKYYLANAKANGHHTILTFGGAYSNHIAATALAAKLSGLQAIGLIRGEEPAIWSHTLQEARSNGMTLHFLSRTTYDVYKRSPGSPALTGEFGNCYIIPEGGVGDEGVKGAGEILELVDINHYTHIVSAVGTGTTVAGLIEKTTDSQQITGISSMKNNISLVSEIETLLNRSLPERFRLLHNYHFGGYARYNNELIAWINDFYERHQIPLDFVYTGKMMYAVFDLVKKDYFPSGSKILAVHSGGLQGNRSLPEGVLQF
ncbi:MAG: 1-aminocyclopropane-1-carboxylate deaminase/D-cysteine desulfhydrase [Agriterribacter sp.]